MERRDFLALLGLGVAGAGIAACSSPATEVRPPTSSTTSSFPIGAAARARTKPVQVTMWHSMTSANLAAIKALAAGFNSSQHDVRVSLVNQDSYAGTLAAYTKALSSGTPPDILQMDSSYLQMMVDSHAIVAVQDAIDADRFDLADFLPSTTESFRIAGSVWAMPFNCSVQLLYYDKSAFSRAGLDPDAPPRDTGELHRAATAMVNHGPSKYGLAFKTSSSSLYQWLALGGETVVNFGNGHDGRATEMTIDGTGGTAVFDWLSQMFKDNLAQAVPSGSFDNLLAIGNQSAPMTLDSSDSLGSIMQVLASGHYKDVELAVAPTPGALSSSASGGPTPIVGGLHLVNRHSAAELDASWQFVKYLTAAASQAKWAASTGSVPVRRSAAAMPEVTRRWDAAPGHLVAYDQIASSPGTAASSGPLTGPASSVDAAVQAALVALASGGNASSELSRAVAGANAAIAGYDRKL
jgi:sn-glycerol 3-phosphate transport system substrate-binding protein